MLNKKITKEQQIAIKRKLMLKPANWHRMDFRSRWLHLYQQQLQLQQEKQPESTARWRADSLIKV
jgi:hypothetical protein